MQLKDTIHSQRRELATDHRGIPSTFARAMKALDSSCVHCSQPAVRANGAGIGWCAQHWRERDNARADGIRERERLRRAIDVARQEHQ